MVKTIRHVKEKKNCIYCGLNTSMLMGHWKLISVSRYEDPKKPKTILIDNCYAHIGCYVQRFHHTLLTSVVPLSVGSNPYKNNVKAIAELCKIHLKRPKQIIKANIKFLEKMLREFENAD